MSNVATRSFGSRSRSRVGATVALCVLVAGLTPGAAGAQALGGFGSSASAGVGITYEEYRFDRPGVIDISTLSLLTVPWAARISLFGPATLELAGAYASGAMERPNGSEVTLSGFTDTQLNLGIALSRPGLVTTLSAIASLPTGHATHSREEAVLAGIVAADLLPFQIADWGSGGMAGAGLGLVRPSARGSFGVSAGYLVAREFEPLDPLAGGDAFVYRPGNQVRVSAAADRAIGDASKVTLSLGFQHFQADALNGNNLYRAGNRFQAMSSYAFPAGGAASGLIYLGGVHRDAGNAFATLTREIPRQVLVLAGGGVRVPTAFGILLPSLDSRIVRTDSGRGQGHLTSLGGSLEMPFFGNLTLVPSARFRYGAVLAARNHDTTFLGGTAGISVRFGGSRR